MEMPLDGLKLFSYNAIWSRFQFIVSKPYVMNYAMYNVEVKLVSS